MAPNSTASGAFDPSTTALTVRLGVASPYWAKSVTCSATTSSASSFSRLVRTCSTAEVSAGAAKGAVSFQKLPCFTSRIESPPAAPNETSCALALSTATSVTFSCSPSFFGSCLRSTNQMYEPSAASASTARPVFQNSFMAAPSVGATS